MKKMAMLLSFLAVVFLAILPSCVSTRVLARSIPLPSNINIVPPDPSLPKGLQVLSGRWEGRIDGVADIVVIFEKVDMESCSGVNAWGDYMYKGLDFLYYYHKAGFARFNIKVSSSSDETVTLSGRTYRFSLRKDMSTIDGWNVNWGTTGITLHKVK